MKVEATTHHPGQERFTKGLSLGLLAMLIVVLVVSFLSWVADAKWAIQFPYQIDYGEGIVWQQAIMILRGEGYSDITRLPFVVFHYPPVLHLLTGLFAGALNIEYLAAGRIIAVVSTLGTTIIIGILIFSAVRTREGLLPSLICGLATGLIVFTFAPIAYWSLLMRVDMLAIFFSFLGIYFGLQALERPRYIYFSALFFLLALFTKQTSVAAPLATLLVLMVIRPRLAGIGFVTAFGLGLLAIFLLQLSTDGRFLEHIITYNINRLDFSQSLVTLFLGYTIGSFVYFVAAAYFMLVSIIYLARTAPGFSWIETLRRKISSDQYDRLQCFIVIYYFLTTLSLISIAKSGGNINYLLEWMFVWSIAIGLALRRPIACSLDVIIWSKGPRSVHSKSGLRQPFSSANLAIIFAGILFQALSIRPPEYRSLFGNSTYLEQQKELVKRVREADKPVISDNMVAILQAGKEVVWEPAIFAELAALNRWDERPLIQMVRSNDFAFFITEGKRGEIVFDSRYTDAVLEAIEDAYPRTENLAGFILHHPQE